MTHATGETPGSGRDPKVDLMRRKAAAFDWLDRNGCYVMCYRDTGVDGPKLRWYVADLHGHCKTPSCDTPLDAVESISLRETSHVAD